MQLSCFIVSFCCRFIPDFRPTTYRTERHSLLTSINCSYCESCRLGITNYQHHFQWPVIFAQHESIDTSLNQKRVWRLNFRHTPTLPSKSHTQFIHNFISHFNNCFFFRKSFGGTKKKQFPARTTTHTADHFVFRKI